MQIKRKNDSRLLCQGIRGTAVLLLLLFSVNLAAGQEALDSENEVKQIMDQAKKLGAKGQLPLTWWDLEAKFKTCREDGCSEGQWRTLKRDARLLLNKADLVNKMRQKKSGMEALLGRYDQSLEEVATLYGVALDPEKSGPDAAADLLEKLTAQNLLTQGQVDSLRVENRYLNNTIVGRVVAQDSIITRLTVEISALRQKLWETEVRAGVAEADRSAAETVLSQKQAKEQAIASIRSSIGPGAGEVLLTPEGDILMRITGIAFGVGSAELRAGQDVVVDRIAAAVELFPGSRVEVSGHTDNTGSRAANLRLSRRRAETVARLLETNLSLAEGAIATEGFGPDRPVALNDSDEGRAKNRRIDVVIKPE